MFFYNHIKINGSDSDMLKATQNISLKYTYDLLILCVKTFRMKSYSMEFKSKKVILLVSDNSGLSGNTFQQKLTSNQLIGFYMTLVFTKRSFRIDIEKYIPCGFNNNY